MYVEVCKYLSGYFFSEVPVLLCGDVVSILGLVVINVREPPGAFAGLLVVALLDFLVEFLLVDEGDGHAVGGLHEHAGRQSALVLEFDGASALLTVDH